MSVIKAIRSCFNNTVEVSGIVIARDETMVRPERPGLKVSDVMADPGDTVSAGQVLARLTLPAERLVRDVTTRSVASFILQKLEDASATGLGGDPVAEPAETNGRTADEDVIGQLRLNGGDGLRREEALAGAEHHLLRLVVERRNFGDWCARLGDDGRGSPGA